MTAITYLPLDPPVTPDAHYFTLEELRVEQDMPATYPDAAITPNRDLAEQVLEHACNAAFLPRRRTETVTVTTNGRVHLGEPLGREVEQINDGSDWAPADVAQVTIDNEFLVGARWTRGTRVTVTYTHGYETPPLRIRRAAMTATRVWTTRGPVDDRATQIASDGATVNLATPGLQESITGIPEVDAAISQHQWPTLVG